MHFFTASVLVSSFFISTMAWPSSLEKELQTVLDAVPLAKGTYGLEVRNLQTNTILFSRNPGQLLNPGSSIKVLTAAAALSILGPNYRFETEVAKMGDDLCLIGKGDPSLVTERLWLLVEKLRRAGITHIRGDLIMDDSFFHADNVYPADFHSDHGRAFLAPIGALSANFNTITIHGRPSTLGKKPFIAVEPDLPIFQINNHARTSTTSKRKDLRAQVSYTKDKIHIDVSGNVGLNKDDVEIYRSISRPSFYTGHIVANHLKQAGGLLKGRIVSAVCPDNATAVFTFKSKPLSQIIFAMNKFSNNFTAEMLIKHLAKTSDRSTGVDRVKSWLESRELKTTGMILENGSGLSRKTRISPHMLNDILISAINDLRIGPELLSSFSIGATDGTLKDRFNQTPESLWVRAKSGSLYAVVSLTGAVANQQGSQFVFSFIFNTRQQPNWKIQKLEETLISTMVNHKNR